MFVCCHVQGEFIPGSGRDVGPRFCGFVVADVRFCEGGT